MPQYITGKLDVGGKPLRVDVHTENICSFIKANKERCKAIKLKDNEYCNVHAKGKIDKGLPGIEPDSSVTDIKKFLLKLAVAILKGKVKPMVGNAATNAVGKGIECIKIDEVQQQFREVLEVMKSHGRLTDSDCTELTAIEKEREEIRGSDTWR